MSYERFTDEDIEAMSVDGLRQAVRTVDTLAADYSRLLDAAPPCPAHGPCVPYALEWMAKAQGEPVDGIPFITADDVLAAMEARR